MKFQELIADHQLYHSNFQMDHLITIRAGGTTYGQYKQALRELYKRYRGLKELYAERELAQIDAEELTELANGNTYDARRNRIRLAQKRMALEEISKNIEDTEREFQRFYAQAEALKEQIGELTPERRAALDRDMWEYKLKEMAALDLATSGRLSLNTYEFIGACPPEMRKSVLRACADCKGLLEWFETKHDTPMPKLPDACQDVRRLLEGDGDV